MTKEQERQYYEEICNLLLSIMNYYSANGYVALEDDLYHKLEESMTKLKLLKYYDYKYLLTEVQMHLINYKHKDNYYYRDDDALAAGIMFMKMRLPKALSIIGIRV